MHDPKHKGAKTAPYGAPPSFFESDTERSGRPPCGLPALLAHLSDDPSSAAASGSLQALARMEAAARRAQGGSAATLHHHLGLILELRHGDPVLALAHLERAAEQEPARPGLTRDLCRIHWRRGQWDRVMRLLERQLESRTDARDQAWFQLQRGQILELGLEQPGAAHEAYLLALEAAPDPQILLKLRRTLLARGEYMELANICRRWATQAKDPWLGALLWREVGLIEELRLGRPGEAVAAYRAAVELEPGDQANTDPLARTLQRMERWSGLADLLVTEAEAESEGPRQRDLLLQAAQIQAHRLGQPGAGRELASAALAGRPGYLLTLMGLAQAPPRGEELATLLDDLERQLAGWAAPRKRAALHLTIGRLCAEIPGQEPRAARHLLSATHLDPDLQEAHPLLLSLGLRAGRWREAAEACEALLQHAEERSARLWLLRGRAELLSLALGELAGAADAMEEALGLEAGARFALDARSWLLNPTEDPRGLEQALGRLVQRITEPTTAAALLAEVGDVLAFAGATADGLIYHQRACQMDGARGPALDALERGALARGDMDSVATALDGQLSLEQEAGARASLLLRLGLCHDMAGDPEAASECLEEAATLEQSWLILYEKARHALSRQRPDAAAATLEQLAKICADQAVSDACKEAAATLSGEATVGPQPDPNLQRAATPEDAARLMTQGRWEDAAATWEAVLQGTDEPAQIVAASRALGGLYAEVLTRPAEALAAWQNVLEFAPAEEEAQGAVYRLLMGSTAWHDAARFLAWLLEADLPPASRAAHLRRLARLCEERFDDPRQAVELLQQALALQPTSEENLDDLIRLLAGQERWAEQGDAFRTFLSSLPPGEQRRGIRHRMALGRLLHHRLAIPDEALEQFRAVVEIDPTHVNGRLAVAVLLEEMGAAGEALTEHRELLELDPLNPESLSRSAALWADNNEADKAAAANTVLAFVEGQDMAGGGFGGPPIRALRAAGPGIMEATLAHPEEHGAAMRVLDLLGSAAGALPPGYAKPPFSGSAAPLPQGGGHPVMRQVMEISRLLGISPPARVLVAVGVRGGVAFHASRRPGLVVDRALERTDRHIDLRRFLGRALAYHRTFGGPGGLWLAHQETSSRLDQILQAVSLAVGVPTSSALSPDTKALSRAIISGLQPDQGRQLAQRFQALQSGMRLDVPAWEAAMKATADRCALWVTGDLAGALEDLRARLGGTPDAPLPTWCADEPRARELVKFWLSAG